ncbi:MAG: M14 family metallopeptidase [Anaerolineales bacterium]
MGQLVQALRASLPLLSKWRLLPLLAALIPLAILSPEAPALADERHPATPVPSASPESPIDITPIGLSSLIGESIGGRPLVVYQFGDGEQIRMIIADIHGGYEWNTRALADELIAFLEEHPEVVPDDITLYVLPSVNPDGDARSREYDGRANDNGVDLNRNFPLNWQETWAPYGCWNYLPIESGRSPLSEPESRAVARFLLSSHVQALISYHSAGLGIFAGGTPTDPKSARLAETIAAVTDYPFPPRETGCEFTGQLADWAAANGISAIDVELSTHYSLDLSENTRALLAFLRWQR